MSPSWSTQPSRHSCEKTLSGITTQSSCGHTPRRRSPEYGLRLLRKHVLQKVLAARLDVDASALKGLKLQRSQLIQMIQWTDEAQGRNISSEPATSAPHHLIYRELRYPSQLPPKGEHVSPSHASENPTDESLERLTRPPPTSPRPQGCLEGPRVRGRQLHGEAD